MRSQGAQAAERSARRTRRQDRRSWSLLAALLYLGLALVLPGVHLGFHRADHSHPGGGQQRSTASFLLAQRHAGAPHAHGAGGLHAHPGPSAPGSSLGLVPAGRSALFANRAASPWGPDLLHGAGSLAHFAGSLLPGTAQVSLPLAGLLSGESVLVEPPLTASRSALRSALHARAPPPPHAS